MKRGLMFFVVINLICCVQATKLKDYVSTGDIKSYHIDYHKLEKIDSSNSE